MGSPSSARFPQWRWILRIGTRLNVCSEHQGLLFMDIAREPISAAAINWNFINPYDI